MATPSRAPHATGRRTAAGRTVARRTLARRIVAFAAAAAAALALAVLNPGHAAAATRGLTHVSQLRNAPIPASCDHKASTLRGYHRNFGPNGSRGFALLDIKHAVFFRPGNSTIQYAAVPLGCSAGGVSWPELLLVYAPGKRLLGHVNLGKIATMQEHEDVTKLTVRGHQVAVDWNGYDGAGFAVTTYKGTLAVTRTHKLTWRHTGPLTVDFTTDGTDTSVDDFGPGIYTGTGSAIYLAPTPRTFRTFIAHRWQHSKNQCGGPGTIVVQRYSHKGFAVGVDQWYCGLGNYQLWGRIHGTWKILGSWGDEGSEADVMCSDLTPLQRHGLTVVHGNCAPPGSTDTGGLPPNRTLGTWPQSGQ